MHRRLRIRPRFVALMLLTLMLVFGLSFAVAQSRVQRVGDRLKELTLQRNALMDRVDELEDTLAYVQTDAYVERVARDELNLIKPGEVRYVAG